MSRGYWDYKNEDLKNDLFGWDCENRGVRNIFEDRMVSDLVYDVFGVIYALDSYKSGDWCEEDYREEVNSFKEKWLKPDYNAISKAVIDKEVDRLKKELYQTIGVEE